MSINVEFQVHQSTPEHMITRATKAAHTLLPQARKFIRVLHFTSLRPISRRELFSMASSRAAFSFVAVVLGCLAIASHLKVAEAVRTTYYDVGLGACGETNRASDMVCAVSSDLYNNGAGCGNYYTLTYNGNSVTVKVVDLCPGCPSPGFDLSSGAFSVLADTSVGVIDCDYTQV